MMNGFLGIPCSTSSWTSELNAVPDGSRPTRSQTPSPSSLTASVRPTNRCYRPRARGSAAEWPERTPSPRVGLGRRSYGQKARTASEGAPGVLLETSKEMRPDAPRPFVTRT